MTSEELNKIKQLFATDDLSNHILGALLYLNNGECRTYQKLFWLIVNDRNGWKLLKGYNLGYNANPNEIVNKYYVKTLFGMDLRFKIENNKLYYGFINEPFALWFESPDKYKIYHIDEIYKLFQDIWEDLIEKHCKY